MLHFLWCILNWCVNCHERLLTLVFLHLGNNVQQCFLSLYRVRCNTVKPVSWKSFSVSDMFHDDKHDLLSRKANFFLSSLESFTFLDGSSAFKKKHSGTVIQWLVFESLFFLCGHWMYSLHVSVNGCLSLYIGAVIPCHSVLDIPRLSPNVSWDWLQLPPEPIEKDKIYNGWRIIEIQQYTIIFFNAEVDKLRRIKLRFFVLNTAGCKVVLKKNVLAAI